MASLLRDPQEVRENGAGAASIARTVPAGRALSLVWELAIGGGPRGDVVELGRRTVDIVRDVLGGDAATLYLWCRKASVLVPVARNDPASPSWMVRPLAPGQGAAGAAFESGQPVIVADYPLSEHAVRDVVARGIRSLVAAPLTIGCRRVGVLVAWSYAPTRYTRRHVRLLQVLAQVAAPGLEAAEHRARRAAMQLTPREKEILLNMIAGQPAKRIARLEGITEATVRTHIRSVLAKLGVNSQVAAVAVARELGFGAPHADLEDE